MHIRDQILDAVEYGDVTWKKMLLACIQYMTEEELYKMLEVNDIYIPIIRECEWHDDDMRNVSIYDHENEYYFAGDYR